jgi:uncharacterized protein (DUF433 family)
MDRFEKPLYTVGESARYLDVPERTFYNWAHGYHYTRHGRDVTGPPALTTVPRSGRGRPVVPFIGLAEGYVLSAIRRSGVPMQRIRPAIAQLDAELGLAHVLASRRLYSDGAEVLYDYATSTKDEDTAEAARELVVVRNGQRVFNEVVSSYLTRLDFAADDYASLIRLPAYAVAELIVEPSRGFGQPIFARGGARLDDALALFRAGEPLEVVADEYGIPRDQLEDAVRVATRVAA